MSKLLAALGLLTLTASAISAQGRGVGTSQWTDGEGNVVNVTVTDTPQTPHSVTFQDAAGFTPAVNGAVAPGSSANRPTVSSAPEAVINSPEGYSYRVRSYPLCGQYYATVEQKKPGHTGWTKMRMTKRWKRTPSQQAQPDYTGPGNEGTSLPPERL